MNVRSEKEDSVTQGIELSEKLVRMEIDVADMKEVLAKEERRSRNLEKELGLCVAEKAESRTRASELES